MVIVPFDGRSSKFSMATNPDTAAVPKRELAAIMFSDIAGYTAIMGRDEERAMRALA